MDFTEEQLLAIDIRRLGEDACIVAGPGSGKTTVLVERYRQLIASGLEPFEILAITFTEKAAANMRRRLAAEFAGDPEMLRKLDRAYVSTIHGFCSRLLRDHATAAGVDPEFTILDEQVAVLEQARALRETLDRFVRQDRAAMERLLHATCGADLEDLIPGIYDGMRAAGVRPNQLREYPHLRAPSFEQFQNAVKRFAKGFPAKPNLTQREAKDAAEEWLERAGTIRSSRELLNLVCDNTLNTRAANHAKEDLIQLKKEKRLMASLLDQAYASEKELLIQILAAFDDLYRSRKFAEARLDFNDLEFYAVRLLEENPEVRQSVNDQFRLVMIDEFQDTSAQQSRLVELVRAPGRFYAVGDLNQSIYSFRHASPRVFESYRNAVARSNAHLQELVQNWRSREPILLTTQLILRGAAGIAERDLSPSRQLPPRTHPCIEAIACEQADEDEDAYALEAAWVVDRILHLRQTLRLDEDQRPAQLSDFAILFRNMRVIQPYLDALERANLDYNLNRRNGFFETREARDLLHLLRAIHNARDAVSMLVVLRSAFAGVSEEALLRLSLQRGQVKDQLMHADLTTFSEEDRIRLERFRTAFGRWRAAASQVPIDRLLLRALDDMGVTWNPTSPSGENIEKFLTIARSYPEMTLGEFVEHAQAMRAANPRESDAPIDESRDAVQIMTVHAAKGLEFPVVILAAMDKGVDAARSPVLNFTPEFGLGVKWLQPDGKNESGLVHQENKQRINATEAEEANRLLYVALTRAQEHLILCWTQKPDKEPAHWGLTVSNALALGQIAASPEAAVQTYYAPNQRPFEVRVLRTAALPPPFLMDGLQSQFKNDALVLDAPLLTDQFDPDITATALSRFHSCPRKYYLASFLGFDGDYLHPRAKVSSLLTGNRASEIGTQVHRLLAGDPVEKPDLEATRLAQVFERSVLGRRSYKAAHRETEWDFVFALDNVILRGTIDLWFEDASGIAIVDYKTDTLDAKEAADRTLDYTLQLQVYALALEKALGKRPDHAWLHFLRPEAAIPVPIADSAATVLKAARELTLAQERVEFPLHTGPHCRRCEFYRNLCPAKLSNS